MISRTSQWVSIGEFTKVTSRSSSSPRSRCPMENELEVESHQFKDWIIFMSLYNDIDGRKKVEDICVRNSSCVSACAKLFRSGCWTFFGPKDEKRCCGNCTWNGQWNSTVDMTMKKLVESGHPVYRLSSPLTSSDLNSRGDRIANRSLQRNLWNGWVIT